MAQRTVRTDDDLKERLNNLARHEGKTTSDVVRLLVKEYVQDRDRSAFYGRSGRCRRPKSATSSLPSPLGKTCCT